MSSSEDIGRFAAVERYGSRAVEQAEEAYREFHGGFVDPREYRLIKRLVPTGHLVALGPCAQINYLADKGDGIVEYYHRFGEPLPILAHDNAHRLYLVGGGYAITAEGIED